MKPMPPEVQLSPPVYSRAETRGIVIGLRLAEQACDERAKAYRDTKAPGWFDVDHECTQCAAAIRAIANKFEQSSEPPSEQKPAVRNEASETK